MSTRLGRLTGAWLRLPPRPRGLSRTLGATRSYRLSSSHHDEEHGASLNEHTREDFWGNVARKNLEWSKPFEQVLDTTNALFHHWFVGGELNVCNNAVDRHVANGRGEQTALAYDSPLTGQKYGMTYAELQGEVSRFAGVLASKGVEKGDRVIIYMPMILEAIVAMLACARIGAVHSVVFGGFASKELAVRIDDAQPKAIVSASCGVEPTRLVEYEPLLQGALELSQHKCDTVIVKKRQNIPSDQPIQELEEKLDWDEEMAKAQPHDCVPVLSTDPLYLLYTSGTTGAPKGILRDSGGHATMLSYSMQNFMNVSAGDTFWAASDIGWVVGHSYIVYGPLLTGCRSVVYEGKPVGTPDAGAFWRVMEEYAVKSFFTAPTALRAIRKVDQEARELEKYDLKHLQAVFLAGERADPETVNFYAEKLKVPIVDNFWQTETGAPVAGYQTHEAGIKAGSVARPTPGFDVQILCEETSAKLGKNTLGDVCIKLPMPPGALKTIYNADERYVKSYLAKHPGYYLTGDAGLIDDDGYLSVLSRTDDVINVAGHRLATGALEEVIIQHPDVAECAVVGAFDAEKGQVPVAFLCLSDTAKLPAEQVEKDVIAMVRQDIGPVASFKIAFAVPQLPKTRSGKILRGIMQKMTDEKEYVAPGTIEDINVLDDIHATIRQRYLQKSV